MSTSSKSTCSFSNYTASYMYRIYKISISFFPKLNPTIAALSLSKSMCNKRRNTKICIYSSVPLKMLSPKLKSKADNRNAFKEGEQTKKTKEERVPMIILEKLRKWKILITKALQYIHLKFVYFLCFRIFSNICLLQEFV